jgi:glycosyl transferase family 25
MKITFYLINLDGSTDRLQSASEQLQREAVDFVRVPAFDGRGKNVSEFKDYDQEGAIAYMGRPLRGGEIGCYYSHLKCIDLFLASDDEYAVVIEDDVAIPPGGLKKLRDALVWLDAKHKIWDVMNFGAQKNKIYSPLHTVDGHQIVKAHYFPMTTTGIVWTRQGARSFLQSHPRIYAPIDNTLREWQSQMDKGISMVPPLVSTTGAESDIDSGTAQARNREGRMASYGVKKQWRLWKNKFQAFGHKFF